ncbi:shikimate kinase [Paenibacillus tarimensis]|uniref:shikimate kinase n=1 Tax=Paenibacillus tarimensis TaxID=416012 RepID=UPI001F317E79|nr:shikimate kinase [Paenibacillus tarimensis]MCF2942176.1 shikimate kinase [Paenibacillus tarimensis]
MDKPSKIVLIGFMGTGKSTVAKVLEERLGLPAIDLDAAVTAREGRTIADIFAARGEAYFRKVESEVLASAMTADSPSVIATGGGAVLAEANRSIMLENGFVAALKADAEHIIARVRHDKGRPLLEGDVEHRVRSLLESRRSAYDFAHLIIDTTDLTPERVADRIQEAWVASRDSFNR